MTTKQVSSEGKWSASCSGVVGICLHPFVERRLKPLVHILEPPKKARRGSKNAATRSNSLTVNIKRAMISAPAVHSFRHVAHVGINKDGVFEASKGLNDTWKSTLADMQGHGISVCDSDVLRQSNFGDGFWKGVEAIRAVDSSDAERFSGRASYVSKYLAQNLRCLIIVGKDIPRKMASASAM